MVLVGWDGGVRVKDFYYSEEARLAAEAAGAGLQKDAAAEELQGARVAGDQRSTGEGVVNGLDTQTEGQQLQDAQGLAVR